MIAVLYERIKVIYIEMMTQYPGDVESRFKSVLTRRFNLLELRAVCAKYTHYSSTRSKIQIIHSLYLYFISRIHLPSQQQQPPGSEWLEVRRLPTVPDQIPDFARDLEEQPASQEEHDITWYIDTTPSPVTISSRMLVIPDTPPRLTRYLSTSALANEGNRIDYWNQFGSVIRYLYPEFRAETRISQIKKYNIVSNLINEEIEEGSEECAICYESINCVDLVKLNCAHKFCGSCIKQTLCTHNNIYCSPSCALCRKTMTSLSVKNPEIYNLVSEHCNL